MRNSIFYTIIFLILLNPIYIIGQPNLDSLWSIWQDQSKQDTIRLTAIHKIAWEGYLFAQPDSAFYFAGLQYDFAKKKGLKKQMGDALNTQGASYYFRSDYVSAIDYYTRSLKIKEEMGNKKGIASSLNNIGNIYFDQGNYAKSIDYHTRSLKIGEDMSDKEGISGSLNNIGLIYYAQGDYDKAIDYFFRSLKIGEDMGDRQGIAASLNNIGLVFKEQDDYPKAIEYYTRSLEIREDMGDKLGIVTSLNNLGIIYKNKGNYTKAISYSTDALAKAQEVGSVMEINGAASNLYEAYKHIGNHKASLEMHELYITTLDSIENIETQKEVIRQEFKYNYEKQTLTDSLAFVKQRELDAITYQAELDKEANQRYAIYAGLGFLLILIVVYLRIRFIKNQAEKKELLQEIKLLKAETIVKMASSTKLAEDIKLNKEKIEAVIDTSLNQTDWRILNALYKNPAISNREIAEQVSLSIQGVNSSLKKMYQLFDLQRKTENQRIAIVIKAVRISTKSTSQD